MCLINTIIDAINSEYESLRPSMKKKKRPISEEELWGNKDKRDAFAKYRELIRTKNITDIEQISKILGKPVSQVLLEVQSMLDNKYVIEMYIDYETNTLILCDAPAPQHFLEPKIYDVLDPTTVWAIVENRLWLEADRYATYEQYREIIRANVTDIEQIAETVKKPYLQAQLEIQSMILARYIVGVHVDTKTGTIVPGDDPDPVPLVYLKDMPSDISQSIICKSCGATNPVEYSQCGYCGSDL